MNAPLLTAADLADPFPEFRLWVKCLPFLSQEKSDQVVARLKRHAMRGEHGCILWDAAKNNHGYGTMNIRLHGSHFKYFVHRLSWQLVHGRDIPPYIEIDHGCETPACFSPVHVRDLRRTKNRRLSAENTNNKKALRYAREMGA